MTASLADVMALIDAANAADPTLADDGTGTMRPAALLYGERMSATLEAFQPDAGQCLQIACRAQHLERWRLPRADYPMTKPGYHAWRNEQKRRHGERAGELMRHAGYGEDDIARVRVLIGKEGIKRDADVQALEDVACLVFLQWHAMDFAAGREAEELKSIMAKTLAKMSEKGRAHAATLALPQPLRDLAGF